MSDAPLPPVGIQSEYSNAIGRLIDDFYHYNHDLLFEGIRLHYLAFLQALNLSYTLESIKCFRTAKKPAVHKSRYRNFF